MMMTASGRQITRAALGVLTLVAPMPAEAVEISGGVGVGGILTGTVQRLAVSPHASISWRMSNGFLVAIHELLSFTASKKGGVGAYNQLSGAIGYAWESVNFSVGPTFSFYTMSACSAALCGRVAGVAPGAHAQTNIYFAGPFGVSVNANLDWVGGNSVILPGAVAAVVVAGPVLRWTSE